MIEIYDNSIIRKEWHDFVKYGQVPRNIRKEVLTSWENSKELMVNPFSGKSGIVLSKEDLNKKLKEYKTLIDITKPFMQKIYQNINAKGYIIFLTDEEGNILYIIGDNEIKEYFKNQLNFVTGASWSEEAVGTTAVSMIISSRKSTSFMAEEKYSFALKRKACAGVPIKNINDELIGILGVAANFPDANNQIYGILIGAQMAIENRLRMIKMNTELQLINHYYKTVLNSVSEAIITIDNRGNITDINEKAEEILNDKASKIVGREAKDVINCYPVILDTLKSGIGYSSNNTFIINTKNRNINYNLKSVTPILGENNQINGCVSILNELDKKEKVSKKRNPLNSKARYTFKDIIGESSKIKEVKRIAKISSESTANILITGESGTGKEYFAQAIHNASSRTLGNFIAVNCGAIPKELIESEFFGYEGGSFTGARKEGSPGKFEMASGGTIFLDEIGEMSKDLQVRLLRILQEREVIRVGGRQPIPIDIRVIAATNKDLMQEVRIRNFRQDLFWRLNVITINVPTLAQRKEDIILLARHFVEKHSSSPNKEYVLHKDTLKMLINYSWPGNVRELENNIERALLFVEDNIILPKHLPEYLTYDSEEIDFNGGLSLSETERQTIERAIHESGKNLTQAARILGISRPTLYSKLKKYRIC